MNFYLLEVTGRDGKIFKCVVKAHNEVNAVAGFFKMYAGTREIRNIKIENVYVIDEQGMYLESSM